MKPTARLETVKVTADGDGLVSRAGTALLAELADRTRLTAALSEALRDTRERRSRHDPGRVLRDLAPTLCDGGDWVQAGRSVSDAELNGLRPDDLRDLVCGRRGVVVLPDAYDRPPGYGETGVGVPVSKAVRFDLSAPPTGVRFRPGAVIGAAMPVAAIAEDGDHAPGEDDVGATSKLGERCVVDAVAEAAAMQLAPKCDLGGRVSLRSARSRPVVGLPRVWLEPDGLPCLPVHCVRTPTARQRQDGRPYGPPTR